MATLSVQANVKGACLLFLLFTGLHLKISLLLLCIQMASHLGVLNTFLKIIFDYFCNFIPVNVNLSILHRHSEKLCFGVVLNPKVCCMSAKNASCKKINTVTHQLNEQSLCILCSMQPNKYGSIAMCLKLCLLNQSFLS